MSAFVLFNGSKRVTLRPEDMMTLKLSVIFQVKNESIYLTDDANVAIFPEENGTFFCLDLQDRGHYEVHGDRTQQDSTPAVDPPAPSARFSFQRPHAASAASSSRPVTKAFQRNVFIGEILEGKLETSKMVTARFGEFEACVPSILAKVREALGEQEPMILTDSQGNEILDTEGTRGSSFWKQNSRKVFAVLENQLGHLQANKRKRLSRRDDTASVVAEIEEVVEAAQELKEVTKVIQGIEWGVCAVNYPGAGRTRGDNHKGGIWLSHLQWSCC
ncbi:uncharacterized protein LOC114572532 [Perca flavescens]|uniref:uncharacterized protein LOC114572532 n=1 Tax=Perca flavescens TaxID=8167 RepID=UPI00106EEA3D|nr:uncharacterized protein LOC114572532 [Perca flavescens]